MYGGFRGGEIFNRQPCLRRSYNPYDALKLLSVLLLGVVSYKNKVPRWRINETTRKKNGSPSRVNPNYLARGKLSEVIVPGERCSDAIFRVPRDAGSYYHCGENEFVNELSNERQPLRLSHKKTCGTPTPNYRE